MDDLDREIEKAKRDVADLHRKTAAREAELRGLLRAAALRPGPLSNNPPTTDGAMMRGIFSDALDDHEARRTGRQPGAISKAWRQILAGMFSSGKNPDHNIPDIEFLAEIHGVKLSPGSALARMLKYVELGYVEVRDHGRAFRVTPAAVERFGLDKKEDTPESGT